MCHFILPLLFYRSANDVLSRLQSSPRPWFLRMSSDDGVKIERDAGMEEVEVEAVWEVVEEEEEEVAEAEEIDPLTLGVPGLKTLIPGDRVEVLWRHGAASLPMLALTAAPIDSRHTARGRAGWERGRVKECLLEMRAGRPVIIYHLAYDDGEEV